MSTVYNLEPNPTAKVVLHTTSGDLEIELFAKQTPLASRNFLQLCLDGYFDNTIFHRLVPGFIVQGGDPTGTGHGGESSYDGEPFADEFHSRLKFNRRGLLGMANSGKKDDNGSQFFFTLGITPELQGKNTMFGRIAGDTIYNLMKIGEADIAEGSEDRPMYPTKITGAEIIINPFEDMVKRVRAAVQPREEEKKIKKPKRKAGKALLSFGGEDGDDEPKPKAKKPKYNPLISVDEEQPNRKPQPKQSKIRPMVSAEEDQTPENDQRPIPIRKSARNSPSPPPRAAQKPTQQSPPRRSRRSPTPSTPSSREPSPDAREQSRIERTNAQIAELYASMKRNTGGPAAAPAKKKSALEAMIPETSVRGRKRGKNNPAAEKSALDILASFKAKLEAVPSEDNKKRTTPSAAEEDVAQNGSVPAPGTAADEEEVTCDLHFVIGCQSCTAWDKQKKEESDDDAGWMSHALSFAKDRLGKDLEWKRKNEEELVVIDPREKARELKEQGKARKGKERAR